jgi:hypothetical protein
VTEPLVAEVAPELARRLEAALRERGEPLLAGQVPALRITRVCRCGQPYCASFWTSRRPMKRWLVRGRQVEVRTGLPGEVALTVVQGEIAYVEVLFWDDVRAAVGALDATGATS